MFEESGVQSFGKKGKNGSKNAQFDWKSLPVDLLIQYRDEITKHLPPLMLKDMNLEGEVLLQYHQIRLLQTATIGDDELALNQRAQVANAVTSVLNKLTEMQEALYSSERFKRIENLLIRTLVKLPEDLAAQFLMEYERILQSMN